MTVLTDMTAPFKFGPSYELFTASNGYVWINDTQHARAAFVHVREIDPVAMAEVIREAIARVGRWPTLAEMVGMRLGILVLAMVKAGAESWPDLPTREAAGPEPGPPPA